MVDLYQPLLRSWCFRAGVLGANADDLCQDALTAVVFNVSQFDRRNPGAFRAWLRTILANRLKRFFRDRKEWDRDHDRHVAARIMKLVQQDFAPTTWQAFCRLVLDGAAAAEVAAELGVSVNAVLLAKSRVLKRLRSELGEFVEC